MTICYQDSPRRRWYDAYHLQRLLRRENRQNRIFKAHFWQASLVGCLLFWGVVAYGIHSL
jgi:hypothetical protein